MFRCWRNCFQRCRCTSGSNRQRRGGLDDCARTVCRVSPRLVKENGRSINEKAPTFATNVSGMTPSALRAALNTSHSTMPNLVIKDDEADGIIAYILSLRDSQ
jgi:hypothetical protein